MWAGCAVMRAANININHSHERTLLFNVVCINHLQHESHLVLPAFRARKNGALAVRSKSKSDRVQTFLLFLAQFLFFLMRCPFYALVIKTAGIQTLWNNILLFYYLLIRAIVNFPSRYYISNIFVWISVYFPSEIFYKEKLFKRNKRW